MLGFGLGFRHKHGQHILSHLPPVDWFEFITENHMEPGGRPRRVLREVREHYPVVFHGVSLSIGSCDPLNQDYLLKLKSLIDEIQPEWVSDHLCWTGVGGHNSHNLLPLPLTEKTIDHVVQRIHKVQEFLGRAFVFENLSNYLEIETSMMSEADFIVEVLARTGGSLLLDVNNVYVSSHNLGTDPFVFLEKIPVGMVKQIHLAGHQDCGTHLFDTHDREVRDEVWELYRFACRRFGSVATMIERDDRIPEFDELFSELMKAKRIHDEEVMEERHRRKQKDDDGLRAISKTVSTGY